jgi:hypothetical protein
VRTLAVEVAQYLVNDLGGWEGVGEKHRVELIHCVCVKYRTKPQGQFGHLTTCQPLLLLSCLPVPDIGALSARSCTNDVLKDGHVRWRLFNQCHI